MNPPDRYGISLQAVDASNLEWLRQCRNAPHVVAQMAFQAYITPEMHAAWWAGLDLNCNRYFIFSRSARPLGVVHLKEIDWERKSAEAGVFTASEAEMGSPWPVLAVLSLMDHAFEDLGLEILEAKMRADHAPILDFNRRLGYQAAGEAEAGFLRMRVHRQEYLAQAAALRAAAWRLG